MLLGAVPEHTVPTGFPPEHTLVTERLKRLVCFATTNLIYFGDFLGRDGTVVGNEAFDRWRRRLLEGGGHSG
jgi:hypothetical protein